MKDGTTAIYNIQTGIYTPTPIGECKPSECDLGEHEEIVVWSEKDGGWVEPEDDEPSDKQKSYMNIKAFAEAIIDEIEKLEGAEDED